VSRRPEVIRIEDAINERFPNLGYRPYMRLLDEVGHWRWAVKIGLCSARTAERRASRRAAQVLARLAGRT
jgi:hypothetical protein